MSSWWPVTWWSQESGEYPCSGTWMSAHSLIMKSKPVDPRDRSAESITLALGFMPYNLIRMLNTQALSHCAYCIVKHLKMLKITYNS